MSEPSLRPGSAEAVVLNALRTLIGTSSFVHKDVTRRLQAHTGLSLADVSGGLAMLAKADLVQGVSLSGQILGRVSLSPELVMLPTVPQRSPAQILWDRLVEECCRQERIDISLADRFKAAADALADLPEDEVDALLDGLIRLHGDRETLTGLDPAIVSARYLQGSAKLLGAFGRTVAALGIAEDVFDGRPRYVVAAGPPSPSAVLLVENPASMEMLVKLGVAERLLVLGTFGYGLTWTGIARVLSSGGTQPITLLVRSGAPPDPRSLQGRIPFLHWGDLDHEGLRIFTMLRAALPELQLSALYRPMIQALQDRRLSHRYIKHTGKDGQRPLSQSEIGDDQILVKLSVLCRERAIDQETIDIRQWILLTESPLTIENLY